jgi:hypothetical protein
MVLPCLDEKTGIRTDFIFSFTPYEEQAVKNAKAVTMNKVNIKFAAPEDVVILKITSVQNVFRGLLKEYAA